MSTVNVARTGKTIQVLPVAEKLARDPAGKPCVREERSFEWTVELPKLPPRTRFLLHVRSMNGQFVNAVFGSRW